MRRILKKRYVILLAALAAYALLSMSYRTPILSYGKIGEEGLGSERGIPVEDFVSHIEFLKAHQYRVLSLQTYLDLMEQRKRPPRKSVVLTFDGGYEGMFVHVFPVLKKVGFPATFFVRPEQISRPGFVTYEDMEILLDNAMSLGCLETHNPFLLGLKPEKIGREADLCREKLEGAFGHGVYFYRYPAGGFALSLRKRLRDIGYRAAVLTGVKSGFGSYDPYALKRIRVDRSDGRLIRFWAKISGFYQYVDGLAGLAGPGKNTDGLR